MRLDELIESDRGPSSEWEGQWLHQAGLIGQVCREWVELRLLKGLHGTGATGVKGEDSQDGKKKASVRGEGKD